MAVLETGPPVSSVAVYRVADGRREVIGTTSGNLRLNHSVALRVPDGKALCSCRLPNKTTAPNPQLWVVHRQGDVAVASRGTATSYLMITIGGR